MSEWQKRWDKFRVENEVSCEDFIAEGYHATEVMEEFFKLETKSLQEKINRLTIAYQNASDQRQHYVEKCLKLSEVVLELYDLVDQARRNYMCEENAVDARDLYDKHKDLIEELNRNLEVKSE
jgi:hypothetical protein